MYEIYGLQRKMETLERELAAALERIDRLEAMIREEDRKIRFLEREVEHEQQILTRIEHELPGHKEFVGL